MCQSETPALSSQKTWLVNFDGNRFSESCKFFMLHALENQLPALLFGAAGLLIVSLIWLRRFRRKSQACLASSRRREEDIILREISVGSYPFLCQLNSVTYKTHFLRSEKSARLLPWREFLTNFQYRPNEFPSKSRLSSRLQRAKLEQAMTTRTRPTT